MGIYILGIVFIFGLIIGSFINAFTYRIPRGIDIFKGRSKCPECKKKISWYDNIPLLSFALLKGKCRHCRKKISLRYPIIEFVTAVTFVVFSVVINQCNTQGLETAGQLICKWSSLPYSIAIPYLFIVAASLITIFITDLENKIIPDNIVFSLIAATSILSIMFSSNVFLSVFIGFAAGAFLQMLNIITKGKGMGMGDVKLAIFGGMFLGWPNVFHWLSLSFIIGAIIGIALVLSKKAKFGKPIPFGPFLIVSLFLVMLLGHKLVSFLNFM